MFGTLCKRVQLDLVRYRYHIFVKGEPAFAVGDALINVSLVLVTYIVYKLICIWKKHKQKNHVVPLPTLEPLNSEPKIKFLNMNFLVFAFIIGNFN